ncbi:MAG: Nif3-like dinuclear metal center hexameric protein [Fuerstiella sp.]
MIRITDIMCFLEDYAPSELAEDWDNTGLLIGRREAAVDRILTCLTLTPDVADEAVEQRIQLVVSHHPVLFRGVKQITDGSSEGSMLLRLIEHGVAVYSPHTSFDSARAGINRQLAERFGLTEIQPIRPHPELQGLGSGRMGSLSEPVPLPQFLGQVRRAVRAEYLEFSGSSTAVVSRVAVACGAAADFLKDAMAQGCDTFVTGEARFHAALEARAAGVSMVLLGHYSSERPAVEQLAAELSAAFPALAVFASRVEQDPLTVFTS